MESKESEFNYALEYLKRINNWFIAIAMAKAQLDLYAWNTMLVTLFDELSTEIVRIRGVEELNLKLSELELIFEDVNKLTKNNTTGLNSIPPKLFWKMNRFEIYLRQILDEAGYQTKRKDDFLAPDQKW